MNQYDFLDQIGFWKGSLFYQPQIRKQKVTQRRLAKAEEEKQTTNYRHGFAEQEHNKTIQKKNIKWKITTQKKSTGSENVHATGNGHRNLQEYSCWRWGGWYISTSIIWARHVHPEKLKKAAVFHWILKVRSWLNLLGKDPVTQQLWSWRNQVQEKMLTVCQEVVLLPMDFLPDQMERHWSGIWNGELYNQEGIDISIDYRKSEPEGSFFPGSRSNNFNLGFENNFITISYRTENSKRRSETGSWKNQLWNSGWSAFTEHTGSFYSPNSG